MKTIEKGATVDDFVLSDQHGAPRRLSDLLAAGPVVLFFYPAAMSGGCTAESCHFRDLSADFAAVGAQPVGISADPPDKQRKFDETNRLGYPLLSDSDGVVATALGVKRRILVPVKRVTLIIDPDRTVADVISSEFSMTAHADHALAYLRGRTGSPS